MKALTCTLFALFLITGQLQADLGSCLVYQAKFYLKDGTIVKGGFEAHGYDSFSGLDANGTNAYCSDAGMLKLIKILQRRGYDNSGDGGGQKKKDLGRVPVYKNLYYAEPRPFGKRTNIDPDIYGFSTAADIVFIDSNDISKVIFWSVAYTRRGWLGSELIIGTRGMIDTVENQRFWNSIVVTLDTDSLIFSEDAEWGYRLINYNSRNNVEELKRLARSQFTPQLERKVWQEFRRQHRLPDNMAMTMEMQALGIEMLERKMQQIRMWFWKRGILMVKINGNC